MCGPNNINHPDFQVHQNGTVDGYCLTCRRKVCWRERALEAEAQLAECNDVVGHIRRVIDKGGLFNTRDRQVLAIIEVLDSTKAGLE